MVKPHRSVFTTNLQLVHRRMQEIKNFQKGGHFASPRGDENQGGQISKKGDCPPKRGTVGHPALNTSLPTATKRKFSILDEGMNHYPICDAWRTC